MGDDFHVAGAADHLVFRQLDDGERYVHPLLVILQGDFYEAPNIGYRRGSLKGQILPYFVVLGDVEQRLGMLEGERFQADRSAL